MRCILPWLSVPHVSVTDPRHSELASASGIKTMTLTRTPRSSSEAIVRKASPLANAQGALRRLSFTANYRAFLVEVEPAHLHPPIATFSPSALASNRKTSPRSNAFEGQRAMRSRFTSTIMNFIMRRIITGRSGRA